MSNIFRKTYLKRNKKIKISIQDKIMMILIGLCMGIIINPNNFKIPVINKYQTSLSQNIKIRKKRNK